MAFFDTTWYVNFGNGTSTGYYAVPSRPQNTAVVAGQLCRQFTAPAVGSERVFVCTVAGTTANTTDATWVLTRGSKTTDGTATWIEVTGVSALNGDLTNTPSWATVKVGSPSVNLGVIIKRNNGASYQIAGNAGSQGGSEPAFSDTAGATTVDSGITWTSLGPVTNFTGGQAPHARLGNALTANWFASGNTVYVGDNHAESQASSMTMAPSSALLARILCHNHSGSYPPAASDLMAGATISTTVSSLINITGVGSFYFYGLTFKVAVGVGSGGNQIVVGGNTVSQVQNWYYFDNCSLQIADTGGTGNIQLGGGGSTNWAVIVFNNTTVKFGAVAEYLLPMGVQFTWQNTGQVLVSGSAIPNLFFRISTSTVSISTFVLEALDLSQLTGSLFSNAAAPGPSIGDFLIKDCKLNVAATITQPINTGQVVQNSRSSALAAPYVSSRHTYEAVETTETSIVRTGGFTDPTGQVQSRKIFTSANAQWLRPYKAEPYAAWDSVVGSSVTAILYGTVNSAAPPNNDDLWLELQYLGSGSSPLGSVATTGKAQLWSSNAALPSDGSSWSNTPPFAIFNDGSFVSASSSNNGLTLTQTNTTNGAGGNGVTFVTTGKYYLEFTLVANFVTGGSHIFGLITSAVSSFSALGTNANSMGISTAGTFTSNGGIQGGGIGGTSVIVGDVIGFALNLDTRLCWVRRNGGIWNNSGTANPATGVGGTTLYPTVGYSAPAVLFGNSTAAGSRFTINCGQSAFANAAPSGYVGFPTTWYPFKLATSFTPNLPGYILGRIRAAKPNTVFYIDPQLTLS